MNQVLVLLGFLYWQFVLVPVSSWIVGPSRETGTIHELTRNKHEDVGPQSAWTREERAGL